MLGAVTGRQLGGEQAKFSCKLSPLEELPG